MKYIPSVSLARWPSASASFGIGDAPVKPIFVSFGLIQSHPTLQTTYAYEQEIAFLCRLVLLTYGDPDPPLVRHQRRGSWDVLVNPSKAKFGAELGGSWLLMQSIVSDGQVVRSRA